MISELKRDGDDIDLIGILSGKRIGETEQRKYVMFNSAPVEQRAILQD